MHAYSTYTHLRSNLDFTELLDEESEEFDINDILTSCKRAPLKRQDPWLHAEAGWDEESVDELEA